MYSTATQKKLKVEILESLRYLKSVYQNRPKFTPQTRQFIPQIKLHQQGNMHLTAHSQFNFLRKQLPRHIGGLNLDFHDTKTGPQSVTSLLRRVKRIGQFKSEGSMRLNMKERFFGKQLNNKVESIALHLVSFSLETQLKQKFKYLKYFKYLKELRIEGYGLARDRQLDWKLKEIKVFKKVLSCLKGLLGFQYIDYCGQASKYFIWHLQKSLQQCKKLQNLQIWIPETHQVRVNQSVGLDLFSSLMNSIAQNADKLNKISLAFAGKDLYAQTISNIVSFMRLMKNDSEKVLRIRDPNIAKRLQSLNTISNLKLYITSKLTSFKIKNLETFKGITAPVWLTITETLHNRYFDMDFLEHFFETLGSMSNLKGFSYQEIFTIPMDVQQFFMLKFKNFLSRVSSTIQELEIKVTTGFLLSDLFRSMADLIAFQEKAYSKLQVLSLHLILPFNNQMVPSELLTLIERLTKLKSLQKFDLSLKGDCFDQDFNYQICDKIANLKQLSSLSFELTNCTLRAFDRFLRKMRYLKKLQNLRVALQPFRGEKSMYMLTSKQFGQEFLDIICQQLKELDQLWFESPLKLSVEHMQELRNNIHYRKPKLVCQKLDSHLSGYRLYDSSGEWNKKLNGECS